MSPGDAIALCAVLFSGTIVFIGYLFRAKKNGKPPAKATPGETLTCLRQEEELKDHARQIQELRETAIEAAGERSQLREAVMLGATERAELRRKLYALEQSNNQLLRDIKSDLEKLVA